MSRPRSDDGTAEAARLWLIERRSAALPALLLALRMPDWDAQHAVEALVAEIGDPEALESSFAPWPAALE